VSSTARTDSVALYDLRRSRTALRAESARVEHWRRLLRARIDLTIATAALPGRLGENAGGTLPPASMRDLRDHLELVTALQDSGAPPELGSLGALRELDHRLASYEATVSEALGGATDELIRRLAMDPSASLHGLLEILDPR
jgi:hypothetical protein